jgi:hypothetical protein
MMCESRLNQNSDIDVSTCPLPGIGVGKTTSKAEMRSVCDQQPRLVTGIEITHFAAMQEL